MANLNEFERAIKIPLVQSLLRFEDVELTDAETEKLLTNESLEIPEFSEEESLIINNVLNALTYMQSLDISKVKADMDLFIKLNSLLAMDQALFSGSLRNGFCSIPCIGQIPVPAEETVKEEIAKLNSISAAHSSPENNSSDNYKLIASECFCNLARLQPFWDGNKRTALCLCNMELLKHDFDLLIIPKDKYAGFEERLTLFYKKENDDVIGYLARNCFMKQRC